MSIIHHTEPPRQGTHLIEAWLQELVERDKEQSTIDTYTDIVRRAHAELTYGVPLATADEIRAWIWKPGRAPASRKLYRAAFASFFSWATHPANPKLDFDPVRLIPTVKVKPGKPRPITSQTLEDILGRARKPYRFWFKLAAGAGFRCIEISRCDRDNITEESIWVLGKGSVEALIPTHPAIWADAQHLPTGPVAVSHDGMRASHRDVSRRGNRALARMGHPDVTMHRLRHYYGSQVRRAAGGDLRIAQEGLRHADPKQTAVYTDWINDDLIAAVHAVPLPI